MTAQTGSTIERMATSIGEQAHWPMDFSHGLVTAGPHAHHRGSNTIVLSGGYGGYMKGNYSSTLADFDLSPTVEATSAMAEKLWGTLAYSADPSVCLYTPQLRAERVERLHAMRMAAQGRGLAPDAALDWLFISVRNRYFVAETTRLWNAYFSRFDPLYALAGARLALSLPRAEHSSTVVALDLMRRWEPRLAGLPFDRPKVSASDALDPALKKRVFNPARLHALLNHDLKHRGVIRQVHNLHATLLWLDPERQQGAVRKGGSTPARSPEQPTPAEPSPAQPAPTEPKPAQPTPAEPTPTPGAARASSAAKKPANSPQPTLLRRAKGVVRRVLKRHR